jgi:hypothetical protein
MRKTKLENLFIKKTILISKCQQHDGALKTVNQNIAGFAKSSFS